MPRPTKTARKPRRRATGGIGDRIVSVGSVKKGMKLLVYGRGKTGKTMLFGTFPKPALLIGTEDGTLSVANIPDLDFIRIGASEELSQIRDYVIENGYASVCLDTAGGLQDLILAEILGLSEVPIQRTWGMAKQKDWGTCGIQLKGRMSEILSLAEEGHCEVMVIAHERQFGDDDHSDIMTPTVGAALSPNAAGWLNGAVDYVCQTFIREGEEEQIVEVAGKKISKTVKTDEAEYCLRIGPHPVYLTGFRCSKKAGDLPDHLADPTYDKILDIINS